MERPAALPSARDSDASGCANNEINVWFGGHTLREISNCRSPRTTASEGKKEKKKHKKEKKHKDGKHHRKSQPPGSIEPVPSKPTLVASNRDPLGVNLSEAELLLRTLNDLSLLPPSTPSPPISSPAIAKVLFAAIDADRVDLALALVVLGADINSLHSTRGITVLALAAEKGDNDAIKYVLVVFFFFLWRHLFLQ